MGMLLFGTIPDTCDLMIVLNDEDEVLITVFIVLLMIIRKFLVLQENNLQ